MHHFNDSYVKEFDATVTSIDGRSVTLDTTHFYPVGGGQPADTGTLTSGEKKFTLLSVKKRGDKILHEVDAEGLAIGDAVHCTIDWERRYKLMRSHTAAHVVSAVIHKETGAIITGNQLSEEKVRIDFSLETFDPAAFQRYIDEANAVIGQGIPVTSAILSREEAMKIPNLSKLAAGLPPQVTEVRVLTIEGLDQQACGGTHVKNTEEIGRLTLLKTENKGKSNRRLSFTLA